MLTLSWVSKRNYLRVGSSEEGETRSSLAVAKRFAYVVVERVARGGKQAT